MQIKNVNIFYILFLVFYFSEVSSDSEARAYSLSSGERKGRSLNFVDCAPVLPEQKDLGPYVYKGLQDSCVYFLEK